MSLRRRGDRRDGTLIRDLDPMHFFMGVIYPNRCDNEAYISEKIDLTAVNQYLKLKNENETEFPYTMFHLIVAALVKTITLRPKLNRFIVNGNYYQRNEVSAAFVVKKKFSDHGEEALAFLHMKEEDTLDSIHEQLRKIVLSCRSEKADETSESMDLVSRLPRGLCKAFTRFVMFLDKHGRVPKSFIASDPYYASVVLSNLGSIKLKCGYHHLTNWGTCSIFCIVGEKKWSPFFDEDGQAVMKETVDIGLTIDERLADGYYYAKSVRLLKHLLEHPELLERPLKEEVDF